jgi:hypothetical protein
VPCSGVGAQQRRQRRVLPRRGVLYWRIPGSMATISSGAPG